MHQVFQGLSLWRDMSVNTDNTPPQLRKFNARHIPLTLKNLFLEVSVASSISILFL